MKKFLIVGELNAVTYKEIFPLIKENKVWLGVKNVNTDMVFKVPSYYEAKTTRYWQDENGQKWRSLGNACWLTNIDHKKRHEEITLYKKYNAENYPKYDNYDAIEVGKVTEIPMDYDGIMGVPITFLDKYNPSQFEIIWTTDRGGDGMLENIKKLPFDKSWDSAWINGKKVYKRILIKNKHPRLQCSITSKKKNTGQSFTPLPFSPLREIP